MITILSRETAWSHRYIVYENDGKHDVFIFPLEESFDSAEARLLSLTTQDKKTANGTSEPGSTTSKTRRARSTVHTTGEGLADSITSEIPTVDKTEDSHD